MLETSDVSRDADETSSTFSRSAGGGWFSLGSSVTWGSFSAAAGAAAGAAGGDGDAPRRGRVERCCSVSSTDLTDDSSSLDEAAVRLLPRRCCCCCCCCSCGCASTAAVVAEAAAAERVEGISGGARLQNGHHFRQCAPLTWVRLARLLHAACFPRSLYRLSGWLCSVSLLSSPLELALFYCPLAVVLPVLHVLTPRTHTSQVPSSRHYSREYGATRSCASSSSASTVQARPLSCTACRYERRDLFSFFVLSKHPPSTDW